MNIIDYIDDAEIVIKKKELERITKVVKTSANNAGFWEAVKQLHYVLQMNDDTSRFGERVDEDKQKMWNQLTDALLKSNRIGITINDR